MQINSCYEQKSHNNRRKPGENGLKKMELNLPFLPRFLKYVAGKNYDAKEKFKSSFLKGFFIKTNENISLLTS